MKCASETTQKLLVVGGRIHGKNPLRNYIRSGPFFFIETDKDKVRGEKELNYFQFAEKNILQLFNFVC